jgi:Tfp pilus assembly protein FimT
MDLVLVVILLGVLAGVVFPRLRGSVRAAGLDEAAQRVASVVRFARAESVRRGLKVRLTVDAARATCLLELQKADSGAAEGYGKFADSLLDEEILLPEGVHVGRIRQGEQTLRATPIVFKPDGVSEPYTIELTDEMDRVVLVEIGEWMDEVSVVRPKEPLP